MAISEQLLDGINTLQIGNSRGFDIIYSETSSYVYARARMIMKNEQDTNDLVQDTYIQAYQNIHSLQDPQKIFAWLGAIAYRQGMKIYRKQNDVLLDEDNEDFFEQIESEDIAWNPELSAEQTAVGNIIAEIIDELPPLQKAALTAFYYDGLKIDQIAQMYDCSSNTIKSRLNYAKKFVREKVETREKEDNVRLHSVGGVSIFFLGIHQLLSSPKYTVSPAISGDILSAAYRCLRAEGNRIPQNSSLQNPSLHNPGTQSRKAATGAVKSLSAAKVTLIIGSAVFGTLITATVSIAAYNRLVPTNAHLTTPPTAIFNAETLIASESSEFTEATQGTENTEASERIEVPEPTETPSNPHAPDDTEAATNAQEPDDTGATTNAPAPDDTGAATNAQTPESQKESETDETFDSPFEDAPEIIDITND